MIGCNRQHGERRRWLALLGVCLLAATVRGQAHPSQAELPALLERMERNLDANGKLAQQYTSEEFWHNVNFDKNGKKTVDESAKFENLFVEGIGYRRKIEENGKPLDGKAAEEEQKRYDKAVAERRAMSMAQKRHLFQTSTNFSLPVKWLTSLFDNRIVGREQIDGRDTLVVESLPRADVHPSSDVERQVMEMKEKTWIDVAEEIPVRYEMVTLKDRGHMEKGMTITFEAQRVVDQPASESASEKAVWLIGRTVSNFSFKWMFLKAHGTTEQVFSNFKKFHVDIRLLEDSVEEVPATKP